MENLEERGRRRNGTSVFNEPYSIDGIERLKAMIVTYETQQRNKYYSILVDNETVVDKTSRGQNFDEYKPFVNTHTRTIEVRLYIGASPNCNRHIFHKSETTLKGTIKQKEDKVDIKAIVAQALADQERKFKLESIEQRLKKKDKQIRKLKQKLGESSTGLEGIQDLATKAVQIAGMFNGNTPELAGVQEPENSVNIEPEEMTEEEEIFHDLVNEVGIKGIKKALRVMELLSKHPQLEEIFTNELKKKKNED